MLNLDAFSAFLIGLMGAGHCFAMCGGISAAVTAGIPQQQSHVVRHFLTLASYNFGRIISYMIAGAIIGSTIASVSDYGIETNGLIYLRLFAALLMFLIALHIGQWWSGVNKIEVIGKFIWPKISPFAKRFLPIRTPLHAIPFGFIWGWLPCGLVYTTLSWAAVSGSGTEGAIVMLSFGLGTLPAMLTIGVIAAKLKSIFLNLKFKRVNSLFLIAYSIHIAYIAIKQLI
ncbi:sulfite exporter TauE/SafE family protein [Vibrio sp. SS-MA-C1-2]|uniref:sulfite exporter TauE/SafE family protein n=1 Tax=Vibrio sp. SS-MA-C1-2 TaxID=2908646 RepID=UPI001F24C678|nr:sulfite exporter TauE/SafE family protein [Vibrio sp. SS-MA-C1-2]UJF18111.1 sulfite exporter TauE/SafE family protein [Vibrio sp. SS-MA-C1-2]